MLLSKKRKMLCLAVAIMMLVTTPTVLGKTINSKDFENNEIVKIEYEIETPKVSQITINEVDYTRIGISDDYQFISNVNEPKIPFKTCSILLPPNSDISKINVNFENKVKIDLKNPIEPGQQALPISLMNQDQNLMSFSEPDEKIYSSNELFPSKDFQRASIQDKNGYSILFLNIYPFKFNPEENTLEVAKKVKISINTVEDTKLKADPSLFRGISEDAESVAKIVDNPDDLVSYQSLSPPLETTFSSEL